MMKPFLTVSILFLTILTVEANSQVDKDSVFTLAKKLQFSGFEHLISDNYEQSVQDLIGSKKLFSSIRDFENSLYNDIYLSDNYYKMGRFLDALKLLDSIKHYPDSTIMPHKSIILFEKALVNYSLQKYHEAIVVLDSLENSKENDSLYVLTWQHRVYGTKAKSYLALGDIPKALFYFKATKNSPFANRYDSVNLASTYLNIGTLYFSQRRYDQALLYLDTAEGIFRHTLHDPWKHVSDIFLVKAIIKNNNNDPLTAIKYLRSIVNSRPKNTVIGEILLSYAYHNMAISYNLLNNTDSAVYFLEKCRILAEEYNRPSVYRTYKLLGKYYLEKGDIIQASHCYELALVATWDESGQETKAYYETIIEYLSFLLHTDNLEKANVFITLLGESIGRDKLDQSLQLKYYLALGKYYLKTGANNTALSNLMLADSLLTSIIPPGAMYASIDPEYIELYTDLAVINASIAKTNATNDSQALYIKEFIRYAKKTMSLISYSESLLYDFHSKVYAAECFQYNTRQLIRNWINLKPYVKEDTFESILIGLLSNTKSLVSNSQIDNHRSRSPQNIPDSVHRLEAEMRAQLAAAYKELNLPTGLVTTESKYDQISYGELAIRYDSLFHTITSTYPEFIIANQGLSDDEIRTCLNDQTILDYYLTDSLLIIRVIDRAGSSIHMIRLPGDFNVIVQRINTFLHKSSSHSIEIDQFNSFVSDSYALFEILIGPVHKQINGRRLVIIPDGEIAKVSFDILLTDTIGEGSDFRSLPYLTKEYPISYQFSTQNFLYQNSINPGEGYLAILPTEKADTSKSNPDPRLHRNYKETSVFSKDKRMPVSSFVGLYDSTLQNQLQKSQIIHFALHGTGDTTNPLLSSLKLGGPGMTDIYTIDILNSRINADLVILSACNTGSGSVLQNEGIYSIGKAFLVAGSKSALLTTNEIEDHVAEAIVTAYIKFIQAGFPKDIALQKAKLEFLASCPPQLTHPLYWSSFVQYGNAEPLNIQERNTLVISIIILGIISIVLALVFLIWKKRVSTST